MPDTALASGKFSHYFSLVSPFWFLSHPAVAITSAPKGSERRRPDPRWMSRALTRVQPPCYSPGVRMSQGHCKKYAKEMMLLKHQLLSEAPSLATPSQRFQHVSTLPVLEPSFLLYFCPVEPNVMSLSPCLQGFPLAEKPHEAGTWGLLIASVSTFSPLVNICCMNNHILFWSLFNRLGPLKERFWVKG